MAHRIILEKMAHESTPFPYSIEVYEQNQTDPVYHIHQHCQITQNTGGKVVYMMDEQRVELGYGDVLLINSNIPHICLSESAAQRRNLGFYPEMLEFNKYCRIYSSFINILYSNMHPYLHLRRGSGAEEDIIKIIEDIFRLQSRDYMAFDGVVHNRLLDMSILLIQWIVQQEGKNVLGISRELYKSIEYIEQNYMEAITMEDAARVAGLNSSYFSHSFKKSLGISFKQYLNRKRLEEAAVELTTTEKQISEIAFSCGFGSVTSFYENFIKLYKISPKRFRDLNMKRQV